MALFNESTPAGSEAVSLGASHIREIKKVLNETISKIFRDSKEFITGWVTSAELAGSATDNTKRAVGVDHIQDGAVVERALATGAVTKEKIATAAVGDGLVKAAAADAVALRLDGTTLEFGEGDAGVRPVKVKKEGISANEIAKGVITLAQCAAGFVMVTTGTYGGTGAAKDVTGVGFKPDLVITLDTLKNGIGVMSWYLGAGFYNSWLSDALDSAGTGKVAWTSEDGWHFNGSCAHNMAGRTYRYFAFKFTPPVEEEPA